MNLLNLFDIVDAVAAQKQSEQPTDNVVDVPATVQASQANGQPATIVVPVAAASEVEVLEDDHEDSLNIGDEVIIAGNVQYQGKTGRVVDFGRNKHFVIVDLYNFGKHSFHSSNVEHNDYADSEEEDANWRERDHGLFGDDERDEVSEDGSEYYYETLAKKIFAQYPDLSTKGSADELLDAGWKVAAQDLGVKRANWEFNYDEDFPSDFVSAYGELQRGGDLEEGWKQNLAALGTAAALGAGGMAAFGGNSSTAPTSSGPELVNPQQVVQMIKAGKISNQQDLLSVIGKAKNKSTVWKMLQSQAGMEGSSDADAVVQTIAGVREGVSEDLGTMAGAAALGSAAAYGIGRLAGKMINKFDQKYDGTSRTTAKKHKDSCACEKCRGSDNSNLKKGVAEDFSNDMSTQDMIAYLRQHHDKNLHPDYLNHLTGTNSKFVLKNIPLNSIRTELSGLDRAKVEQYKKMDFSKAPPIVVGSDGNILDGYHRATVAKALGIPNIKAYVGVKGQQGVAEGEYDDPRWEPREPDMSRKVDWDIEAQCNAPDKQEPAKTVTVTDNNGKVVLTFPSTGGFYGDLRYATSKGFDTDSGDYHLSWKRDTNEGNNWLDTPVSEEFDRIKKLAGLK